MIFINDELTVLPKELQLEIREMLRGGKKLKLPKRFNTKSVNENGVVIDEHPVIRSVPFVCMVDLDMDTFKLKSDSTKNARYVQVRYAKAYGKTHTPQKPHYFPGSLTDLEPIQEHDVELFWFLYYCSPFVENGLNAKSNKIKNYSVIIDDPAKDEEKEAERDRLIFRVNNLIMDKSLLPEQKIRDIAAAFGVGDSIKGRIDGVRLKLKKAVSDDELRPKASGNSEEKGYAYFETLASDGYDFSLKSNITKSVELGVIEYVPERKAWFFLGQTAPGAPKSYEERIVNCEVTVEGKEAFLENFLIRTPDIKNRLLEKLEEKLGSGAPDLEAEYENLKSQKAKLEADGDVEGSIKVMKRMLEIKPKNPKLKGELAQAEQLLSA